MKPTHLGRALRPSLRGACGAVCLWLSAVLAASGQSTYPAGELLVGNNTATIQSSQITLDANQFWGVASTTCTGSPGPLSGDMCGYIQAAICAAPAGSTNGVVIDARGFTAVRVAKGCASNPFASPTDSTGATLTTTPVTLLLPGQTIVTSATWFLPILSKVIGQNQTVTTIRWSPTETIPSGNCVNGLGTHCIPVICMGLPTYDMTSKNLYCDTPSGFNNTARTQLSGFRIDCQNGTNSVGLVNITAQEQSWFQNGGVENCTNAGVYIGPTGTNSSPDANQVQNSGPFANLEINYGNSSTSSTYGMFVQGGPSITIGVGGHITFNQVKDWSGTTRPNTALVVNGFQVSVADIHCENYINNCILLGPNANTEAVSAHNITTAYNSGKGVTNVVHVSPGSGNTVTGVVSSVGCVGPGTRSGANAIKDDQAGLTYTDQYIASYVVGPSGASSQPDNFIAHGASTIDGVAKYNNVTTAGLGVPAVYGALSKPGLSGSLSSTPIISSAAVAGEYTIHYYADQHASCTGIGSAVFTFYWTDSGASRTTTSATLNLGTTTGNSSVEGTIPIYSAQGDAISVSSAVTGCSGATYDLYASAEQTQ